MVLHYMVALEDALAIVILKILYLHAIVHISALTIFIINLWSVLFFLFHRAIYNLHLRARWIVMAEIFLTDAGTARWATLNAIGIYLARHVSSKIKKY